MGKSGLRRVVCGLWLIGACGGGAGHNTGALNDAGESSDGGDAVLGAGKGNADASAVSLCGDANDTCRDAAVRAGADASGGTCWRLPVIDRARLYPPKGKPEALLHGRIEGSNQSAMNGFVELASVRDMPSDGSWVDLRFDNQTAYRYVKFHGPKGSYGALAELELYAGDERVDGQGFGSAGSGADPTKAYALALDGDKTTVYQARVPDDNYVGLDLAAGHVTEAPKLSPGRGSYKDPVSVTLSAAKGATILYTTDGKDPLTSGKPYRAPVAVSEGSTLLRAVAKHDCMQASEVSQALYRVGEDSKNAQSSMHIGNSLTDTIVGYLQPVAKAGGIDLDFERYTVPGAGTYLYANNPTGGFGVSNVQETLRTRPFDHLSMQPFPNMPCQVVASDDGQDSDSGFVEQAWNDARKQNPDVQLWIYQQWPHPQDYEDCLSGGGWTRGGWDPPAPSSWEDAVKNQLSYQEAVRTAVLKLHPDAKTPYIIPAGNALVALKHAIERGEVPGLNRFFEEIFAANGTDLHLSPKGAYLVTLVFYACMFQMNPDGLVADVESGLDAAQRAKFQELAWQTVSEYDLSGVAR